MTTEEKEERSKVVDGDTILVSFRFRRDAHAVVCDLFISARPIWVVNFGRGSA
jgi:hypothetical protein